MVKKNSGYDQQSLVYVTVELDNLHPVPVNWSSEDASTGYARILLNKETHQIYNMELIVDGISVDGGTNNLDTNPVQPFHFHNAPQGGPNFFVQQLFDVDDGEITTASLVNTDTGFAFTIDETYDMRLPVNNPGLGLDFVFDEIFAGNAYLGVHTDLMPIPETAIAGDMVALANGTIDGVVEWLGDEDDVVIGGKKNDLLSTGAGEDYAFGAKGDDVIDGGADNDRIAGGKGDDTGWGGDGDDELLGKKGKDNLSGNRGDDILKGGKSNDDLNGGLGMDKIVGGRGNDLLTGGADEDHFRFGTKSGHDVITDFVVGEDSLAFAGNQQVVSMHLADLDSDGNFDDTYLTLTNGSISFYDADLVTGDPLELLA